MIILFSILTFLNLVRCQINCHVSGANWRNCISNYSRYAFPVLAAQRGASGCSL